MGRRHMDSRDGVEAAMNARRWRRHSDATGDHGHGQPRDAEDGPDGGSPPIHRRSMTELFILSNPAATGHSAFRLLRRP